MLYNSCTLRSTKSWI